MMDTPSDTYDHRPAVQLLNEHLAGFQPVLAIVLGSGLGQLADLVKPVLTLDYSSIPGFPTPTVHGHSGRLLAGTIAATPVICLQGRSHAYEGHPARALALPIRALRAVGCTELLLTNAAGSLRPDMPPESLMAISDHINWAGINPLIGSNDETIGARFFDMSQAYNPALRSRLHQAAQAAGITLREGVYAMFAGPNFETPAEIRALHRLGADAVGMSTVPECLVANHCGMKVAAVSTITNYAAGMTAGNLSHQETLAVGAQAADRLTDLVQGFCRVFTRTTATQ